MSSRTALFVLSTALLSQGLASAPSTADTAPTPLEPSGPVKVVGHAFGSSLAVDAHGTTTVVWASSAFPHKIRAMRRPAGRHWGEPVVIGRGNSAQAAADAKGRVTVAWLTQREGFNDGVATARRSVAGTWSDPVALTTNRRVHPDPNDDEVGARTIDLAVSSSGSAAVAWQWGSHFDRRIQAAYRPAGGSWGEPANLTPASHLAQSPQVGLDAHGTVVLAYTTHDAVKSRRLVEKGWTEAVKVTADGYRHELAVDKAGNALLVFKTDHDDKIKAAFRPAAGGWGTPQNVSSAGVAVDEFVLAMNGSGAAVVGYTHNNGRIDVVDRPAGGPWSASTQVARSPDNSALLLAALNASGDSFLGWGNYGLFGKLRPASGTWSDRLVIRSDAQHLADVMESAYVAVRPGGGAVVLWDQEGYPLKVRMMATP